MEQALAKRRREIASEGRRVDSWTGGCDSGDLTPRHKLVPAARERAQLGHRCAVASHHEADAGLHGGEDLRILVTQVTRGDDTAHA